MNHIYLIGYRCTGKTSVGQALARMAEKDFIDADTLLTAHLQQTIADFVAEQGWDAFRRLEAQKLREISFKEDCVVSTGGGVILRKTNVDRMRQSGWIVWLQASTEMIYQRMCNDAASETQRPRLTDLPIKADIQTTLAQRRDLYARAADFTVDTNELTVAAAAQAIWHKFQAAR